MLGTLMTVRATGEGKNAPVTLPALAVYRKSLGRTGDALTFRDQVYIRISCCVLRSCLFLLVSLLFCLCQGGRV